MSHWRRGFIWILMAWKEHGGAPRRVLRPLRQSGSPFLVVSEEGRFSTWQLSRHSTSLHSREGMFDTKAVRTVGRDGKANWAELITLRALSCSGVWQSAGCKLPSGNN